MKKAEWYDLQTMFEICPPPVDFLQTHLLVLPCLELDMTQFLLLCYLPLIR